MKNDYVGKIINGPGNQLVNICDISLLNTSISSDKINLNINKGEIITLDKITTKGPGTGISPMKIDSLIGKTTKAKILADSVILEENIDW